MWQSQCRFQEQFQSNAERILNFNPRLREGGDDFTNDVAQRTQISIHASAREATQIFELGYHLSIHFNPRLREGGDGIEEALNKARLISIHASAREATSSNPSLSTGFCYFNPRLREGGDSRHICRIYYKYTYFNPRLREGGDIKSTPGFERN